MSDFSIQPVGSVQPYNNAYQSRQSSAGDNSQRYKSNIGLLGGTALGLAATLDFLPDLRMKNADFFADHMKNYAKDLIKEHQDLDQLIQKGQMPEGYRNLLKKVRESIPDAEAYKAICQNRIKIAVPAAAAALGCTVASGLIIDAVRNKKAKEVNAKIDSAASAKQLKCNSNVGFMDDGTPYFKSNTGKKLAPVLAGLCGVASAYLNGGAAKHPVNIIGRSLAFALGGLVAGTIYDGVSDKHEKESLNYLA